MPNWVIEAFTDSKKRHSKVGDQWLYHLTQSLNIKIFPELEIKVSYDKGKYSLLLICFAIDLVFIDIFFRRSIVMTD